MKEATSPLHPRVGARARPLRARAHGPMGGGRGRCCYPMLASSAATPLPCSRLRAREMLACACEGWRRPVSFGRGTLAGAPSITRQSLQLTSRRLVRAEIYRAHATVACGSMLLR